MLRRLLFLPNQPNLHLPRRHRLAAVEDRHPVINDKGPEPYIFGRVVFRQ